MLTLTPTTVMQFRQCPRLYRFAFEYEPKVKDARMKLGELGHKVLQRLYTTGTSGAEAALLEADNEFASLWEEERQEYGDIPGTLRRLYESYLEHYGVEGLSVVSVEERIVLPLEGFIISGRPDLIFQEKDGSVKLMDHKFVSTVPASPFERLADLQLLTYCFLCEERKGGLTPRGFCLNYVRTKNPSVPELVEKGARLSKRKIDTPPKVFRDAIKAHGFSEEDYLEVLDSLSYRDWFYRPYFPYDQGTAVRQIKAMLVTGHLIKECWRVGVFPHSFNQHCGWCGFKEVCQAEIQGLSWGEILDSKFRRREETRA